MTARVAIDRMVRSLHLGPGALNTAYHALGVLSLSPRVHALAMSALVVGVAVVPFLPGALEFRRAGIQDILLTGDAATLELGTIHARHGDQFVGPYSRFGWNHPGPAVFYLAVPIYEAFHERGPALRLFAFAVNVVAAVALVLSARRLRGTTFAVAVGALLGIYELVALPFLVANEWNPILPILPLALLVFLAIEYACGATSLAPVLAFLGSVIIQTHVGYVPPVACILAWRLAFRSRPLSSRERRLIAVALAICWMLPIYQALVQRPGNLQRIAAFFVPKHWAEHSWTAAIATVLDQLALMPLAIGTTVSGAVTARETVARVAAVLLIGVGALMFIARRRGDRQIMLWPAMALTQTAVAVFAVRAIRGEIFPYLVAWISVIGFVSVVALTDRLVLSLRNSIGITHSRALVLTVSVALLLIAIRGPVPRSPVVPTSDATADALARGVEQFLRATPNGSEPIVRIASRETWPRAVAVVLYLHKRHIPIVVDDEWIPLVGRPFAATSPPREALVFIDDRMVQTIGTQGVPTPVVSAGGVHIYSLRLNPDGRGTYTGVPP